MNTADIPKTAITTPFRLFEFTCMTFGRRNVGNTFLTAARLTANAEKCESSIEFLGHTVSTNGIAPLPSRVVAIASHPCPNNIKKL